MGVRQAWLLVVALAACDALFGLDHVDPVGGDGAVDDGRTDDAGIDTRPSFCAMQSLKKACADFESAPYGLANNFTAMNAGTGAQPLEAAGGLSPPNLLRFQVAANSGTGTDSSIARALYTETGFNGLIAFSVMHDFDRDRATEL